ncbi:hypothetical protein HanRHA438_Chr16g0773271 [Helianthus annuus]|nr:hypothetical protein HanRHA438_Chr16g0773271 [Helianthus annuus]
MSLKLNIYMIYVEQNRELPNFTLTLFCMLCRSLGTPVHWNLQSEELEMSCGVLLDENI